MQTVILYYFDWRDPEGEYMLELKNITKDYPAGDGVVRALKGINLKFRKSEFISILGQSGCGKTTMLNIIGGLDGYTTGDLIINGVSTKNFSDREWDAYRNHSVGFVFQSYNLIPHQSVLQNVELALSLSGVGKAQRRQRAIKALEQVGLGDQINKKPSELSGGQMQRVAIARAIVNNPDIILADEPTGALDSETSIQVMEILKEISKDRLVVMVTHNPELAQKYSTRIVRMLDGVVTSDSHPLTGPEVAAEKEADLAAMEAAGTKKVKKPSMSFATSFTLSLKNLFTKKGRTILTSFAGSIGIIGIALIFAVSQGMNDYIAAVQEDTLSSYPITFTSETADITSMLSAFGSMMEDGENVSGDNVQEMRVMNQVFAQIGTNDLVSFNKYLKENFDQIEDGVNAVSYGYNITPQIYTYDVNGEILQVNPNSMFSQMMPSFSQYTGTGVFSEMIDNEELLRSQYDVLAGRWPEEYNELVLVLSDPNSVTDFLAYSLGLRDSEELKDMMQQVLDGNEVEMKDDAMTWTYDDFLNLSFSLVNAYDIYQYNSEYGVWEDMSEDEEYMKELVDGGVELKIVGIVSPAAGTAATALTQGIGYLPSLTEYIMENAASAQIVKDQLENPDVDVFTGLTFEELEAQEGGNLDFNDMITVDENMLSSAFNMEVSQEDLAAMMEEYTEKISGSLTVDTTEAEAAFMDTLQTLCRGMLTDYMEKNGGSGVAIIKYADVATIISDYLGGSEAGSLFSDLESKYVVPADVYVQACGPVLNGVVSSYIASVSTEGSAPITEEVIGAIAQSMESSQAVSSAAQAMGSVMTEAKMQKDVLTDVIAMNQQTISSVASGFSVDPSKIAGAFNFNLNEDELMRLMQTYSTGDTERSADSNLRTLGYSDPEEPVSISVYLVDFDSKEKFIDFIDGYNDMVTEQDEEDLVISYTDITGVLMSSIKTVIDGIQYVLIAFVSISLVVSSIMIGVITLISVQERTKEIGILRAIGASKRNVSSMFNAETVIIGFSAGLLGVLITYVLCIPINIILHKLTGIVTLNARLPIGVALVLILISVVLTLISGIIPSRSAAKKDPVVALRTE